MNKFWLKKQYLMHNPKKSSGLPSRLPSDFQEVEYIEGNGNQWIDTNYISSIDDVIETDIEITTLVSHKSWWTTIFGGYPTKSLWIYKSSQENDSYFSTYSGGSEQNKFMKIQTNVPYNIIFSKATIIVNGTSYSIKNGTNTSQDAVSLFRVNPYASSSYQVFIGKIKEFKITNNNTTKLDLVPCYRKSDGEVGMYDLVSNTFYTNSGSGSFLKGKDVIYTSTNAVSFATDSWSTIQAEAERISNFYEEYGFIPFNTPYAIYNPENNDTKNIRTITYNNEEIQIAIIGMCHDTLQTSYSGGGTKAGITWQTTKSLFKSAVDSSTAYGGWYSCSLRASLNSTHFNYLPQDMRNAIKVVAKKSNNGSGSITTSNDKLFTLSMVEIMGTNKKNSTTTFVIEDEGTQYEYYKNAPLIVDSNNITWTALSGTKGTCIANGNSYTTLIGGVQTPDANDYINYRNAKIYKPNGNASYYGTRTFMKPYNGYVYVWRAGNVSYTTSSNGDLEVCFAGCI